jgi:tryptophan-rich sensory protein
MVNFVEKTIGMSQEQRQKTHWRSLLLALAVPFSAAVIGNIATARSLLNWYRSLKKPAFNPPAWLFGPVWTVLYLLMGVASWLVWREGQHNRWQRLTAPWNNQSDARVQGALRLYGVHLIFNALWTLLFFGLRRIDLALAEVGILWALILGTLLRFSRIRPLAGLLLVPYQLWVTFATFLNLRIWQLNRDK